MQKIPRRMRRLVCVSVLALVAVAVVAPTASAAGPKLLSIAITPTAHNYGTIDAGKTASKTFVVRNNGLVPTTPLKVTLSGSGAFKKTADSCTGRTLWPQDVQFLRKSCSITVRYAPTSPGTTATGTLRAVGVGFPWKLRATASLTGTSTPTGQQVCASLEGTYELGNGSPVLWRCSYRAANQAAVDAGLFPLIDSCFAYGGNRRDWAFVVRFPTTVRFFCSKIGS